VQLNLHVLLYSARAQGVEYRVLHPLHPRLLIEGLSTGGVHRL
jgi:hypothetical protein